jgi:hypothetical protein
MKSYLIDENTIWEETNQVRVYNFPPTSHTYSYITKVYREHKKNNGWKNVEGNPIYFNDMRSEVSGYAIIMAQSQNMLSNLLPEEKFLKDKIIK